MGRLATAILAMLAAAGAAAGAEQPGLSVTLRPAARAAGRFVRLDEIAGLSGKRAAEAAKVLLGPAPRVGARAKLTRGEVACRLEEEGFDRRGFRLAGAGEVVVRPAAEKDSVIRAASAASTGGQPRAPRTALPALQEKVAGWVRASLAERLSCEPERLEVRVSRVRGALPWGRLTPRVQWPAGAVRLGRQRVGVALLSEGRRVGRLDACIETAARLKVLVATRNIGCGERLLPGDVRPTELRLTDLGASYFPGAKAPVGMCAARPIRAGEALRPRMLKKQKLVRRGQALTVVAEVGAIRVTERAVAKSDGGLGDMIVVERAGKRPPLTVRITGNGIARVD